MSIASAITAAQEKVENAYTAVSNKGGTLPATQDLSNLPTAITSIPTGGPAPVINELNVVPSTSAQTITASAGVDGYSPINVSAVTSSIDANIAAGNIKDGVTILGVTGSVVELKGETKTVIPQVYGQTIYPSTAKNGITEITVNPVTSTIDANITAGNIKKDVSILGVTGTYEGAAPTGTMYIISNGIYDVTDKAIANVQVPATVPALCREFQIDGTGKLGPSTTTTHIMDFTGATDVLDYALTRAYFGNTAISGTVDMSTLTTLSGGSACYAMFQYCTGLTGVDLSSLTTISGGNACLYMFQGCTGITSIDLSSLTTISVGSSVCSHMFQGCTGLTSVNLSALTTISGADALSYMFQSCTGLTSVNLNGLNVMTVPICPSYGQMFVGCTHLESVTFGGLTASTFASRVNQIQYIFASTTGSAAPNGCTIHFPSNFDPSDPDHTFDASTLSGYPTFGGNASYISVAFDLPATE